MIKRGTVYLVNFGKKYNSEFVRPSVRNSATLHGKIRPALVIQNDIANRNLDKVAFKGITVLPLTTNLSGGDLRVLLSKRDQMEQPSEICVNEICTLDQSRFEEEKVITALSETELREVEEKLMRHCGVG